MFCERETEKINEKKKDRKQFAKLSIWDKEDNIGNTWWISL